MYRSRGFTLVELLIALAIFAILSAFAYRGLVTMLESRDRLQAESRKWRDVAVFVGRVERDLRAVVDRAATMPSGTAIAPVSAVVPLAAGQQNGISMTRLGSALQENVLAAPQRVAYLLRDGHIDRFMWGSVDAAPRDDPTGVTVMKGVRAFDLRYLTKDDWQPLWGLPGSTDRIPFAVEFAVTLDSGERIVRVIDMLKTP
jgi:general secretion pathway protein J